MSHLVDAELMIAPESLDAVGRAVERHGCELVKGQTTFEWFRTWVGDYNDPARAAAARGFDTAKFGQCEHVIRRKDAPDGHYEIGLVARRDGQPGWEVLYDNYASGRWFSQTFGVDLSKLKDAIGVEVAKEYWEAEGYRVSEAVDANGNPQVIAEEW